MSSGSSITAIFRIKVVEESKVPCFCFASQPSPQPILFVAEANNALFFSLLNLLFVILNLLVLIILFIKE